MIKWVFPTDRRFLIADKEGTWGDCVLVAEDEETVTFDYTAANNGARMQVQVRRENILHVCYAITDIESLERTMNESR